MSDSRNTHDARPASAPAPVVPGPGAPGAQDDEKPVRRPQGGGFGAGPGGGHMIGSGAKSKNFGPSFRRLLGRLRPHAVKIAVVMVLAIISVIFAISGPKLLGTATNVIFEGAISKQLPAGVTQQQVEAGLRAAGKDNQAEMLSTMTLTPGKGIDFAELGRLLALTALVYLLSAVFAWIQAYVIAGVAQQTVFELRHEVDKKLARLPLRYFDTHSRGDILSRVTNDIDNIANTLQQSLTQIITAVFTLIGVLIMMFSISWLLALIALITVPLSIVVTMAIAKRSQKQFAIQWDRTGTLNGQVEEMHTGHNLVKVFGRQSEALATFDVENEQLFQASFKAQFISGIIMPSMQFISNLQYVAIAVIGGVLVTNGRLSLGDVQAFIQYSRQFTQPITQTASIANVLQSAVASAERVFELLDEPEEQPDVANPKVLSSIQGHVVLDDVSFRYEEDKPLIEEFNLDVKPGQTVAIVGPTGAGKTTIVNLLMRFYEIDGGSHLDRRRGHSGHDAQRAALPLRHGPPGHVAVHRKHPREHRLRPGGRHRGRDDRRGDCRARGPLRPDAAQRLRHRARRRRDQRLAGRATAAHHREGVLGRS